MLENISTIASIMSIVGFILFCFMVLTKIGKTKAFRFMIGEYAFLTAIMDAIWFGSNSNYILAQMGTILWFVFEIELLIFVDTPIGSFLF